MKTIKSSLKPISKYNDNKDGDIYNLDFIHFLRSNIDENNKYSMRPLCNMLLSKKITYNHLLYHDDFIRFLTLLKEKNYDFRNHVKNLSMKLLLTNRENEKKKYNNLINIIYDLCNREYSRDSISKILKKFCFHIKIENRPNVLYHYVPYYILNKLYNIDTNLSENNVKTICDDINLFLEKKK